MKQVMKAAETLCQMRHNGFGNDLEALKEAVSKRHELENTELTSEWLENHGWEKIEGPEWHKEVMFIGYESKYGHFYIGGLGLVIHTLAQLYDVMNLIGVKED